MYLKPVLSTKKSTYQQDKPMLCLTRKEGEKIVIGNNVVLTLLRIQGDRISVGIDAPIDIPIIRYELLSTDQQEQVGTN